MEEVPSVSALCSFFALLERKGEAGMGMTVFNCYNVSYMFRGSFTDNYIWIKKT